MASGYSQPGSTYRHLNPIDVYDEQLVATVLGAKQQRYDKNIANIETALQQYGQIDLARAEDKQHLFNNLRQLTQEIDGAGIQALSSSAVSRNIENHIDQALDSRVLKQIGNTQKIRKFQEEVQRIKEDDKEAYASQNEAYAMHQAGYMEYMGGKSDNLKNLEYNPYVDVAKNQRDILDETFSVDKGITRKVPDGNGYFVESTHHGLTPSEVRNKVQNNLTPQELKQLEINAWSKYGENAPEVYERYVKPTIDTLKQEKEELTLNYSTLSVAEKASVDTQLKELDSTIKDIQSRKESSSQLYSFLGKEELIQGLSSIYSPLETSMKYSSDSSYYKELDNAVKQLGVATGRGDNNNNGVVDLSVEAIPTESDENWVPTERAEQEIQQHVGEMRTVFNSAYNRLPKEKQAAFDSSYKKFLGQKGLEDSVANKNLFMLEKSNGGKGNDLFTPQEYAHAMELERDYRRKKQIQVDNYNEALAEQEAISLQEVFTNLKDTTENGNIMMLDQNGKKVSMRDYLKGVESVGQLSGAQRTTLLKSVYADLTLSQTKDYNTKGGLNAKTSYNIGRLAKVNGETGKDLPMLVHPLDINYSGFSNGSLESEQGFKEMKKDMGLPDGMTKGQFEEHILPLVKEKNTSLGIEAPGIVQSINNGLDFLSGATGAKTLWRNISKDMGLRTVENNLIIGGEGTKTREDLEKAMKAGLYDKASLTDDSVEDDSYIRVALDDRGDFQKRYEQKMANDASNFDQNQRIIVESTGSRKGEVVPEFEDLSRFADFDKGQPIYVVPGQVSGMYRAYQTSGQVTTKNGEVEEKSITKSAMIPQSALEGKPFFESLNKQKNTNRITTSNTKSIISTSTGFVDEKDQRSYVVNVAKMQGLDKQGMSLLTTQGAKNSLMQKHPELMKNEGYKTLVKTMVENAHLFRLDVHANDMDRYDIAVQYPTTNEKGEKVWKNLKVMETDTHDITETVKMIDVAPQMFYYKFMDKLLTNIEDEGSSSVEEDINLIKKILYPQQ